MLEVSTIADAERLGWSVEPTHIRAEKQGHVFRGSVSDVLGRIEAWEEGDHPRSDQVAYALTKEAHRKIDGPLDRFYAWGREHLVQLERYSDLAQAEHRVCGELDDVWNALRAGGGKDRRRLYESRESLSKRRNSLHHQSQAALEGAAKAMEKATRALLELLKQPRDALRSHKGVRALVESFDAPEAQALRDALEVHAQGPR